MAQLEQRGLVQPSCQFETLYGGRTNQVWKVLGGANDAVLKLYRSPFENPLFRNDAGLETACLRALRGTGFVPRLRAAETHGQASWVLYDHAPGAPWKTGTADVAHLLRAVHDLPIQIDAPPGCNGSEDVARHTQRILAACQSDRAIELARSKPRSHIAPLSRRCLIHGDPVAGNILVAPTGLTLIDWQCPALGDPCEDLAIFLSPAMQQIYRGAPLKNQEAEQFLSAYGQHEITARYLALRPWYAWRMAAYCLWRSENGAPDYAAALDLELAGL